MKLKILIILLVQLFWFVNFWHANAQNDPLVAEIEAEDGELDGVRIDSVNTGFSGKGYVTGFDSSADKLTVSVTIYERGFYKLFIRYNGLNGDKYQQLFINGKGQGNVQFPKTETFANIEVGKFLLEEGENLITIKSDWGYTDFDKFEIYAAEKNQFNIVEDLVDPDATEETRALYRFLKLQFGERIISGQTTSYFTELKNLAGKTPMINNEDLKSYTEGYPYKWSGGHVFGAVDDGRVNRLIEWYNSTNGKGIVAFQWHWHSPTGGEAGTNTFYTEYTDFDIRLAVIPGTEEYDLIIRDIDAIALQLKKFQDANIPVIFRPLHEAGGGWFWWGAKGSEPCKKLYDIIFERIKNHHQIHNLIWVWSTPETDWYPGNDKVDIIGHDSYPGAFNYGPQKASFDKLFNLTNGEKLIAMTENGPIPDPGECFELDAPWLWFMSWSNLVNEQNSVEHIQEVFANSRVLTIESTNAKTDNSWRSTLYPENWKPGFKDLNNRFLHDFSYAGYHQGEKEIPVIEKNIVDVTQQPYGADNSGETDVTQIIQQALDDVGQGGGGVVYIPSGTYKVNPGSAESALRIQYNNTILRGAGSDSTFIFNDASYMRQKNIVWMMGQYCTWSEQFGTTTKLSSDLLFPTQIIPVKSVLGFEEGDQIILRTDGTDDFIEEHGMSNIWTEWAARLMFLRQIDSIDVENNLIYIDSPTRYFMKMRDNARIYHAKNHITECGIENLSIGNRQNDKPGWEEETYTNTGTGAYDVHASHAIQLKYAQNCWVKNVNTYKPENNTEDIHILSNGLLLNQCRGITVDSCFFQKPQYEGGGGNGYMFTLISNDCLVKNCRANHSRHNYDFKFPYSNGNVIHNCIGENSKYSSDFHMYLSMSNLIDCFTVDQDYLESTFRPWGGDVIHGYSSTQSVFYNTKGIVYHPGKDYIIESRQFGNGYIIGTSGEANNVKVDPVAGSINGYDFNTAPRDFVEGVGEGTDLFPQSLYLDQLERRMNDSTGIPVYKVSIKIKHSFTEEPLSGCEVQILNQTLLTDNTGLAIFEKVNPLLIINLNKNEFYPLFNKQYTIYSDTTFTFYLNPKEYDVTIVVHDKSTGNTFEGTPVIFNNNSEVTDENGETYFTAYAGNFDYLIEKNSFINESGTVTIVSDTTFHFFLTRSGAYIKFRLKEGNTATPVNNANVILNSDTLISTNLGLAKFNDMPVFANYSYLIYKGGYNDISGNLFLNNDTTVNIEMQAYATGPVLLSNSKIIKIWPNPVGDVLYFQIQENISYGNVEIRDLKGNLIYSLLFGKELKFKLDLGDLTPGMYLLKVVRENNLLQSKFIKK